MYPIPIVLVGCFVFMFTNSFGSKYFSLFLLNFAFTMNSTVRHTMSASEGLPLTYIRYTHGLQAPYLDHLQNVQLRLHL
jgi:hypothetical protein